MLNEKMIMNRSNVV